MKNIIDLFAFVTMLCWYSGAQAYQNNPIVPLGQQYLAQAPPGNVPQVFAESFFPEYIHTTPTFSQDLSEMFWINENKIFITSSTSSGWQTEAISQEFHQLSVLMVSISFIWLG